MKKNNKLSSKVVTFLGFGGPSVILFSCVVLLPFIYGIYLTFTGWDGISSKIPCVGFENYSRLFQDKEFWVSLGKTILYALISVILANVVAFLLAYLVTSKIKGSNFFRAAFFTPNLIGGIVLGYIWQFVFNKGILIIGEKTGIQLFSSSWLSDPVKAFWALIIVTVWQLSGYLMLIYIAGLMGVSENLKEAARIDGCGEFKIMYRIAIPLCVPTIATLCLFYAVGRWNGIDDQLYYVQKTGLHTVQMALKQMIEAVNVQSEESGTTQLVAENIKAASITLSMTPMLVVYPFIQRFFTQGIMLGAVKG